jgi:glutathione S-transferase
VLAICELKGVPYEIDPVIPFYANEQFMKISSLRRIPVFVTIR